MQEDIFNIRLMTRRRFLSATGALAASSALAACTTARPAIPYAPEPIAPPAFAPLEDYATMYGPTMDDGFSLPAIPYQKVDPQFLRQIVPDPTGARPGTVVVDTTGHHLYLVRDDGMAIRYGVGLGRAGFEWSGDAVIQWKQHWPKWTPPDATPASTMTRRSVPIYLHAAARRCGGNRRRRIRHDHRPR